MILTSVVLATLLSDGDVGGESAKKDRELLQGTWIVVVNRVGTRSYPNPEGDQQVTFEDGKMWFSRKGKRAQEGISFTLDTTKSPRQIDMQGRLPMKGIYKIEGSHLRICYHQKQRPTEFDIEEHETEPFNVLYDLERKP